MIPSRDSNQTPLATNSFRCTPYGESALMVDFGDRIDLKILNRVWTFARYLEQFPLQGMVEYVTSYASVMIVFDPLAVDVSELGHEIEQAVSKLDSQALPDTRTVEVPVCYCEDFGPDLSFVARHNGLTVADVIEAHASAEYFVYLIGFVPGFPYLGGMPSRIAAPRLESPRLSVAAGSVGIAGEQTGIYPLETPGGWRLIGRTPLQLFRADEQPPSLLRPGDRVRIRPINRDEFDRESKRRQWPSK